MERLYFVKVTISGTSLCINIPVEIRRALGIERGDYMSFGVYSEDTICIRKITDEEIRNFKSREIKI